MNSKDDKTISTAASKLGSGGSGSVYRVPLEIIDYQETNTFTAVKIVS
jgi:hypothetical protein